MSPIKGPDFVSRLKGTLDIPGVNIDAQASEKEQLRCRLRRAILLHHTLIEVNKGLFRDKAVQIDDGVVKAFLYTSEYRHGVRSLKAVVAMSLLHDRTRSDRSCLPEDSQLELHVRAHDFRRLLREL